MRRTALAIAGVLGLSVVLPSAAGATGRDAQAILDAVNLEREMAGLKPLVARGDLDAACGAHTTYMSRTSTLGHVQSPGSPFFTTQGAWAGTHSVLARSSVPFIGNPWRHAPFHEFQVLHPWLRSTGVAVTNGYACMVTGGDRDAPNPSSISLATVPGPAEFSPPAETAREQPFVPGDEVGLPQGTKTGPHIYVYALGPDRFDKVVIASASLTANADGSSVPLRWVDGSSPRSAPFLTGGAILIPAAPLRPDTAYSLRVEAATTAAGGEKLLISRGSGFTTGPDESDLVETPESGEARAARASGSGPSGSTSSKLRRGRPVLVGAPGGPQLKVSLRWTPTGVKAKIRCVSTGERCRGPLRVLVRRKGGKVQKLRFVVRKGPLRVNLAPGRTIKRRLDMDRRQMKSGHKRGFAVRFGAPAPQRARALEVS